MKYQNVTITMTQNGQLESNSRDNLGHIFKNAGAVMAFINDYPIAPNEILDLTAPGGSIDETKYFIRFEDVPGTKLLYILSKSL